MPDSAIRGHSASSPPSIFTCGGSPSCFGGSRSLAIVAFGAAGRRRGDAARACATDRCGVHTASPSPTSAVAPVSSSSASSRACVTVIFVGARCVTATAVAVCRRFARSARSTSRTLSRAVAVAAHRRRSRRRPSPRRARPSRPASATHRSRRRCDRRGQRRVAIERARAPRRRGSRRGRATTSIEPSATVAAELRRELRPSLLRIIHAPTRG